MYHEAPKSSSPEPLKAPFPHPGMQAHHQPSKTAFPSACGCLSSLTHAAPTLSIPGWAMQETSLFPSAPCQPWDPASLLPDLCWVSQHFSVSSGLGQHPETAAVTTAWVFCFKSYVAENLQLSIMGSEHANFLSSGSSEGFLALEKALNTTMGFTSLP